MPFQSRTLLALTLMAALATPALAHDVPVIPGGDPATRAQDDFFRWANGAWLDSAEIPGDKRSYGTFMILRERAE